MIVLGIESSCDETACAVVVDGKKVLSSIISSQADLHCKYGGVVPEIASRKHMEAIEPVVQEAITTAGIAKENLDGVAVTQGPGLIGALLIGFSFGKSFAYARNLPWIGVNHLEGHINSIFLGSVSPKFPFIALLVSGGHTNLYYVKSHTEFQLMGQTRDDAVGEAYDKVSKMLGLGYPGGVIIDNLAKNGNPESIDFPRSYLDKKAFDFSFSGLKTSVNRYIQAYQNKSQPTGNGKFPAIVQNKGPYKVIPYGNSYQNSNKNKDWIEDVAASFQKSVMDVLSFKVITAAEKKRCKNIAVVGGVAANSKLRQRICEDAKKKGISVFIPSIELCGDNAAMIAATGYHYLKRGDRGNIHDDVYSRPKVAHGIKHKGS